jgi:hypothetical protein
MLILKSTRCPVLIAVKGVPILWLSNQFPGSSVSKMVSAEPPSACAVPGVIAVTATSANVATQFNNNKLSLFMAIKLAGEIVGV